MKYLIPALGLMPAVLFAETPAPEIITADGVTVLDTMVVTGSSVQERIKDAPVRTEVLSRETIQKSAARDLAQAVEYSPGLRVETACGNCNQQQIQMLGLPQSYIAILADGMPTFSSLAGVYGIEQIPAGMLGQIEVVKGGGSALYGPGAVAGVINLIPREPERSGGQMEGRVSEMAGKGVTRRVPLDLFGMYDWVSPEKNVTVSAFANTSYVQPVDMNGDGFTDVSERVFDAEGVRAVWKPGAGSKLSVDLFRAYEERRGGEAGSAFTGPPNLALISEQIESLRQVAAIKWLGEITPETELQLAYAYSNTERDSYYGGTAALGSPDPASPFFDPTWTPQRGFGETTSDLHFLDALTTWTPNDRHRLSFGAQYRNENLIDDQASAARQIDATYELIGVLAQHRWKLDDQWTAEYGVRIDKHSEVQDPIVSPRMALMMQPHEDLRIRNSIGWGFRAPEAFDEDLHIANVGGELQAIQLDPALKEESAVTLAIAPEWKITDEWRLEANFFHTWLLDSFVTTPNDDPATADVTEYLKTNGGESSIYGAELNLGYFASDWRLEFSWTEQRLEYDERQLVLGDDSFGDPADNPIFSSRYVRTPRHLGLIKFTHEGKWFDSFVACKLTGPMEVPRVVSDANGDLVRNEINKSPWFANVDLGVSKKIEVADNQAVTLSLGCKNVFNEFQGDLERGAFRDAAYVYGPAFPRTFFASAKWEF